ncbi:hypothetical protein [Hymenobacter swuensis]|uniref:GOLD domain-containing protein n=1 Tax=Hymenobacter swuensis DY53 TaxID=1227739 RepID=W8F5I8_9BACT|nr:hypothetical protein [Hymenobacter swuensis]AHJ97871.1 hypothetical protein Hsw_2276 [Hymenobacter swuensis DY53]
MKAIFTSSSRLFAAVFLGLSITSCLSDADDSSCSQEVVGSVAVVGGAKTGKVGTPVAVTYTVSIINGCGQFKELREQREANKVYLAPTVRYEGCTCPQVAADYQGTYQFVATQPGQYILNFPNVTKTITDTITIQ